MNASPRGTLLVLGSFVLLVASLGLDRSSFGLGNPVETVHMGYLGIGMVALIVGGQQPRSQVSPRLAIVVLALPVAAVVGVMAIFETILSWGNAMALVFTCGLGLAFVLGAARSHSQQWLVIGCLLVIVVLFIAAGVHEATTSRLGEGIPMMLAIGSIPIAMLLSAPLYRAGTMYRDKSADRSHRLVLTATAIPWVGGAVGYFFLHQYLRVVRFNMDPQKVLVRSLFDVWPTVTILLVGAGFVYGVHRVTRPDQPDSTG